MRTLADNRAKGSNRLAHREEHYKNCIDDMMAVRQEGELIVFNEELFEEKLSPTAKELLQYKLQGVEISKLAIAESYTFSVEKDDQDYHHGRLLRKLNIILHDQSTLHAWLVTSWQKALDQLSEKNILLADYSMAEQLYQRLAVKK